VNDARNNPEVVAEVREFLKNPTHFFAECQAVNAYENDLVNGLFLTPNGFLIGIKPGQNVDFYNDDSPFAQLDGVFESVGGSEPSYTLPPGDSYKAGGIVMITQAGTPEGVNDVWMTGYLDGICPPQSEFCGTLGKVSYLGGHEYDVKLPISTNPKTNGTRLFLNSLFEAQCATQAGLPYVLVSKSAPATVTIPTITFSINYSNFGPGIALGAVLTDTIPPGSAFVSATGGGTFAGGVVTWNLGNLGVGEGGSVDFTVTLSGFGTYQNSAELDYKVGLNAFTRTSNQTSTVYDSDTDGDGVVDSQDICPNHYNPNQDLQNDVESCGACGTVCTVQNGTPACVAGSCLVLSCAPTHADCDGLYATGCEYARSGFADDEANCGGCGQLCDPLNATGLCSGGSCGIGSCDSGWSDCNGVPGDGCEYADAGFQTDPAHCGDCATACNPATETCESGSCKPSTCPAGLADCAPPAGDCETDVTADPATCGGCGLVCDPPNAGGACAAGACGVGSCDAGFADCDALPGNGCEYASAGFQDDEANCGGCGAVCDPPNATGVCVAGSCTILPCDPGFVDCDGAVATGCEVPAASLQDDETHCGGCNQPCAPANGTGACVAGQCTLSGCDAGHHDLDTDPSNGCEYACTPSGSPETACNGADDDCDGQIDESYAPTSCGTGACAAAGTCSAGAESCTPAAPSPEGPASSSTCADGVDNDCDGMGDALEPSCVCATSAECDDGDACTIDQCVGQIRAHPQDPACADGGMPDGGDGAAGAAAGGQGGVGGTGDGGMTGADAGEDVSAGGTAAGGEGGTAQGGSAGEQPGGAGGSGAVAAAGSGGSPAEAGTAAAGPLDGSASGGSAGAGTPPGAGADAGDEGGCGCRIPARASRDAAWLLLAAAGSLSLRRRPRRRTAGRAHG
jgi:uncharacterized repeat protein (TIGR01451 family)